MKLQSTNDLNNREIPQCLWKLLEIDGRITEAFFVSAYCSTEIINSIVSWVISHKEDGHILNLQIYLDHAGSGYSSDEIKKQGLDQIANTLSNRSLFTPETGIYLVQYGTLFHSKGYVIRSTTTTKFAIGSLNLTVKKKQKMKRFFSLLSIILKMIAN